MQKDNKLKLKDIQKEKRISLYDSYDECYEEILAHYRTGESSLSPKQQEILERWRLARMLLLQYPSKQDVVKHLKDAFPDMGDAQLYADVNYCIKFWNFSEVNDRDFIESFFVEKVMREIANPECTDASRAKNLATLQRYIESLPDTKIDPKHVENNQVNIQLNINGTEVSVPESILGKFSAVDMRSFVVNSTELDENSAQDIMDS